MSDVKLGEIIPEGVEAFRDAIHIALAPVVAGETLAPGRHVGFLADGTVGPQSKANCIGIVDPFLERVVNVGERFYLVLYQRSITALRHEWSHPAFADNKPIDPLRADSAEWLHNFAERYHTSFEELTKNNLDDICLGSSSDIDDDERDLFFRHIENYTGKKYSKEYKKEYYFRCAC